jgi:hypothetical protein
VSRFSAWQAALFYVALTAVMTWPQVAHPLSVPDHVDSFFSLWRMSWIAHQLPRDPLHLFDANIFYPLRYTLAFSDAVMLQALVGAPFIWLGVPVALVYNVLVLASFVLCGVGMFLLVRDLTGSAAAGVVAGIVFGFAPYRFDHYFHLELLWAQWMPLTLWMLHRAVESGRVRDGLWTGVFGALQGLSCVYYAVFFATLLAVVVPVLLVGWPTALRRRAAVALAAGGILAAAVLVPYILPYRGARGVVGDRDTKAALLSYAVGPKHYLATLPESRLYGPLLGGVGQHERRLFVGFSVMLLAAIGVWPLTDRRRLAYLAALALCVDISFGHRGLSLGWLRDHVMVYRGLRVAPRVGQAVLLASGILAGLGFARLAARARRAGPRLAVAGGLALGALILAEYLMAPIALTRVQTAAGGVQQWLRDQPRGVLAEFPLPPDHPVESRNFESRFAYLSTFHWQPTVNGYSGFWPAGYILMLHAVRDFPSDSSIAALRARGVTYLAVHERYYGRVAYDEVTRALDARHDLVRGGTFAEGVFEARTYRVVH